VIFLEMLFVSEQPIRPSLANLHHVLGLYPLPDLAVRGTEI
jgi:hypothetical protein